MTALRPALDPQIQAFLGLLGAPQQIDPNVPVDVVREGARALRLPWNEGGPVMAASEELVLAGLRGRLHRPVQADDRVQPVTLYLHGGGWTLLDIDTHDGLSRRLASASAKPVMLLDYPRAPEHAFPAPLLSLRDAVHALRREAPGLGLDGARFALSGDSAGANLALGLALLLREENGPRSHALGLVYGSFAARFDTRSHRAYGGGDLPLSTARMRWFWDNYVPDPGRRREPLVSPLDAELAGLPPAFLAVAQYDVLYDENIAVAERLGAAGNDLTLRIYPGTVHGFFEAAGAVGAAVADRAILELGRFLGRHLERAP